ncbi:MAG TPA: ATP-binding protein, partial [Micromonosporaceae bacterium]
VVTELVANAVTHARTTIHLRMALNGRLLHVAVRDCTTAMPHYKDNEAFGLLLVDAFATRWGADRTETGKVVWATIRVDEPN